MHFAQGPLAQLLCIGPSRRFVEVLKAAYLHLAEENYFSTESWLLLKIHKKGPCFCHKSAAKSCRYLQSVNEL